MTFIQSSTSAADQFIVRRGDLKTIIAGYHWFSDWGRDTMISLPGLTLVTGRFDVARRSCAAFAGTIDQGMLPNRFPDAGETAGIQLRRCDAVVLRGGSILSRMDGRSWISLSARSYPRLDRYHRLAFARHAIQHQGRR